MDKETSQALSDKDKIKQTLSTPGWEVIEKKLDDIILSITDIRNLEGKTREERLDEIETKEAAVSLIEYWISSIKGDAINAENLRSRIIEIDEEEHFIIKE
jgi:hypothetical protein